MTYQLKVVRDIFVLVSRQNLSIHISPDNSSQNDSSPDDRKPDNNSLDNSSPDKSSPEDICRQKCPFRSLIGVFEKEEHKKQEWLSAILKFSLHN